MLLWTMEWEYVEPNRYPAPKLLEALRRKWWPTVLEIKISGSQWEDSEHTQGCPFFSSFLVLGGWGVEGENFCFFHVPNVFPRGSHQVPQNVPNCTSILPKNFGHSSTFLYIQVVRGGQRADSIGDYPMLLWNVVPGLTFVSHLLIHITKWNWYRRSGTGDDQMSHLRKSL
jgi:hypothetical protein